MIESQVFFLSRLSFIYKLKHFEMNYAIPN